MIGRSAIAMATAMAVAGCALAPAMPDAGPSDAGPLVLTLGTGAHDFTPIAEDETLLLARGCQGLQHVWTALRATGIAPRGVHVRVALVRASDGVVVSAELDTAITFTPQPDGSFVLSGLQLVVPVPADGLAMPLVISAEIADREGRTGSAMLEVTLAWGTEICGA